MTRLIRFASLLVCVTFAAAAGCEMFDKEKDSDTRGAQAGGGAGKVAVANLQPARASATQPAMQRTTGTITFTEMPGNKVHVTGEVRGLTPNTEHGFHVHEKGDLSAADLSSAGAHFNPENK